MNLLVLPILLPLLGAAVCIIARRSVVANQVIAVAVTAAVLAAAILLFIRVEEQGIQVLEVGGWSAGYGIVLVADLFSAIMLCLTGVLGFLVAVYSLTSMEHDATRRGYYPLLLVLLCGISGAFLTGDFFNLYVWFEVMLMASFVLVALGGSGLQLEAALKYVTLNIVASVIFLTSLGLLYATAGTMNFAVLAQTLGDTASPGLVTALAVLFMVAFGMKAALFPLFFWLPSSYHTPPVAVSAVFAGLLTKVGVYVLIRVFTLIFVEDVAYTHTVILVVAGLTMVIGVLGAVVQNEFRKILAFHSISQVGYIAMGLGLFTPLALAGSIFFIIHHSIVKSNLFLVSGLVHRVRGTFDLKYLGGLHTNVLLAFAFVLPAMSLAGIPPLGGFFAKLLLARAGVEDGAYIIVGAALAVGFFTMYSMVKIWNEVYAKLPPEDVLPRRSRWQEVVPALTLTVLTIGMGLIAGPVLELFMDTADQLLDRSQYIQAVLGGGQT